MTSEHVHFKDEPLSVAGTAAINDYPSIAEENAKLEFRTRLEEIRAAMLVKLAFNGGSHSVHKLSELVHAMSSKSSFWVDLGPHPTTGDKNVNVEEIMKIAVSEVESLRNGFRENLARLRYVLYASIANKRLTRWYQGRRGIKKGHFVGKAC
jgi:hypothetical protein